jgi:hypothetical protein
MQSPPVVDPKEVEGIALTEHVGAVARDAVGRRGDGDPAFAAKWELDDDGRLRNFHHATIVSLARLSVCHEDDIATSSAWPGPCARWSLVVG